MESYVPRDILWKERYMPVEGFLWTKSHGKRCWFTWPPIANFQSSITLCYPSWEVEFFQGGPWTSDRLFNCLCQCQVAQTVLIHNEWYMHPAMTPTRSINATRDVQTRCARGLSHLAWPRRWARALFEKLILVRLGAHLHKFCSHWGCVHSLVDLCLQLRSIAMCDCCRQLSHWLNYFQFSDQL